MGQQEEGRTYVCIHCGEEAPELYRQCQAGILKIAHCRCCGKIVDRYIEYDPMLIFLDALLHKPQTYRHILHNVYLKWCWKLLVMLVLCDAYIKWESHVAPRELPALPDTLLYAALEWDFYIMLFYTLSEWLIVLLTFYVSSRILLVPSKEIKAQSTRQVVQMVLKAATVSSFGKLLLVPAALWGPRHGTLCLSRLLVYTSNVCAFRVLHGSGRLRVMLVVGLAHLSPFLLSSL